MLIMAYHSYVQARSAVTQSYQHKNICIRHRAGLPGTFCQRADSLKHPTSCLPSFE